MSAFAAWVAPWAPGLAQGPCEACGTRVVAITLRAGRCAQCVATGRYAPPSELEFVNVAGVAAAGLARPYLEARGEPGVLQQAPPRPLDRDALDLAASARRFLEQRAEAPPRLPGLDEG